MNGFDLVVFAWLVSVAVATIVGSFWGRAADAMTLGIFFGPVGLVLAIVWIGRAVAFTFWTLRKAFRPGE